MCVYHMYAGVQKSERASDPLKLELRVAMSHQVVLQTKPNSSAKAGKHSYLLNHPSSPKAQRMLTLMSYLWVKIQIQAQFPNLYFFYYFNPEVKAKNTDGKKSGVCEWVLIINRRNTYEIANLQ